MFSFDLQKFPNVDRWYQNASKVTPGWEENLETLKQAQKFLEEKIAEKK